MAAKGQKIDSLLRDIATSLPCTGMEAYADTEAAATAAAEKAEKAEKQRQSSILMSRRIALKVQADIQMRRDREAAEALKKEQKTQVDCQSHNMNS